MATTNCLPNVWTEIPDTGGAMLLEARGRGLYVDTTGTPPADAPDAYALASNSSMVIEAGISVHVQPAQPVLPATAVSNPV